MDKPRSAEHRRKRQRKRFALIGSAAAVVIAAIVLVAFLKPAAPSVPRSSVLVSTVKQGPLTITVQASGVLTPRVIQWVTAPAAGVVEKRLVRPGDHAKPDSVLVIMHNPEVVQAVAQAKTKVATGKADLASLKAQLQSQLLDLENTLAQDESNYQVAQFQKKAQAQVVKEHIISELDYRQTVAKAEQLKQKVASDKQRIQQFKASLDAQVNAKQAEVAQLKADLAARERDLDNLHVKAGMTGIVTQVAVQDGQHLAIGADIARIAQQNNLMAKLQVAESQAGAIAIGQRVMLTAFGGANSTFAGKVIRVNPTVENGTVEIDVAPVGDPPKDLRSGLDVQGEIVLAKLDNVLYMDRPAGVQAGDTLSVFRLVPDSNLATRTKVELGRTSANAVQVVAGLKPGDKVIVSDTSQWSQYDRIELSHG
ncbi:MAG TPA: efflux RND transporter periplasmic adaptor subunit [Gammaproteobacteria bacterium]|jgi:multidrug efflux pump subunit AcrA (membrane-fusion protein)|nr:efflux RND transporter periplasmic adaptor subunit [Gammaproteobacteria bacterium]